MAIASRVVPELRQHPGAEDHAESGQTTQELGVRVSFKSAAQLLFHGVDLLVELGQDAHGGGHDLAVGGDQDRGGGQLGAGQGLLQLGGAAVKVALAARLGKQLGQLGLGNLAALLGVGAAARTASAWGLASSAPKAASAAG